MCGIIAVYGHDNASSVAAEGGLSLQHRGQETCGIASNDGSRIRVARGRGKLEKLLDSIDLQNELPGRSAMTQLRYATAGDRSALMNDAQPFTYVYQGHDIALGVNSEIYNAPKKKEILEQGGTLFRTTSDTEVFIHLAIQSGADTIEDQLEIAGKLITGSYALLMLYDDKLIAMRDPYGIRPLVMGTLGESHVFASESVALQQIGATYEREVRPGEMITVDKDGLRSRMLGEQKPRYSCIFELIYFGNPASEYNGMRESLYTIRKRMGVELWNEHHVEADCVVPVLDSGLAASTTLV